MNINGKTHPVELPKPEGQEVPQPFFNFPKVDWKVKAMRFYVKSVGKVFPSLVIPTLAKMFFTPRKRTLKDKHLKFLGTSEEFVFMYGSKALKGYKWGQGDRVVLVVHGWESQAADFTMIINNLVSNGFCVYSFDAPGHGQSEGKRASIPMLKKVIKVFSEKVGVPDIIIGHSMGGSATAFFASEIPEDERLKKVVLINAPALPFRYFEQFCEFLHVRGKLKQAFIQRASRRLKIHPQKMDLNLVNPGIPRREILIIHDKDDATVPFSEAKELVHSWPGSRFLITNGLGHHLALKDQRVLDLMINFANS